MATIDHTHVAASHKEAVASGLPFFLREKPCRFGHAGPFRATNYACTECERDRDRARREMEKAERAANAPERAQPDRVILRADAKAAAAKRYFTGLPCKAGHIAERLVTDKTCVECDRLRHVDNPAAKARLSAYYRRNRTRMLEQAKAYVAKNYEAIQAKRKAHRNANKTRINIEIAAWAKANPEKRRAKERAREARERGAEGTHTATDVNALKISQEGVCAAIHCFQELVLGFHVDHIMPIARGGSNWPCNLQLLCPTCNQAKHARDPEEWNLACLQVLLGEAEHP